MGYQGHAGQGGLQNHSIGGCYPFTVFGKGDPTMYGVLNAATGEETAAIYTCECAWKLAEALKRRMLSDLSDFNGQLKYLAALYVALRTGAEAVPIECAAVHGGDL